MKKILGVVVLTILSGCGGTYPSSSVDDRIKILLSNAQGIKLSYPTCLFCAGFPQKASLTAEQHCKSYNSVAILSSTTEREYFNNVYYYCQPKKATYEEKKDKAKIECADMGFRPGTDNFANCVLKLVSKDF